MLQPHHSPAFAGPAPQGSLAVTGEKLLVPNGRSVPAVFDRKTGKMLPNPKLAYYDQSRFIQAKTTDEFGGFALQVGEGMDYAKFKQAVLAGRGLDTSKLSAGDVTLRGIDGKTVRIVHNAANDLPIVYRNGKRFEYSKHLDIYQPADGGSAPVSLGWQKGTLRVQAGGDVFEGTFKDGRYTFRNSKAK